MGGQGDWLDRMERVMNPGLARVFRFMGLEAAEVEGEGVWVRDDQGHTYLDCASGYGVFAQGYRHPRIMAAARRQLERLPLSSRVLVSPPAIELAEALAEHTPGDLQYSFFCNSGAEAVEAAIKFARIATGRTVLVSASGAFHGKTMGALSVSGRALYQNPFRPLVPDIVHVPFGDAQAVADVLDERVAAVIIEPIQGEGGVVVPPEGYLRELRRLTAANGSLLIADEVQTGMGRTGKLWACEHDGVVPDLLCAAKALGGGVMPVGAVVGRPEVWRFFDSQPLIHTSTFGGNPLAMAVAREALAVTVEEHLPERAEARGAILRHGLQQLAARFPAVIRQVRGRGLMLGLELTDAGLAAALMGALFRRQVLAVYTLNNDRVIRVMPPLIIAEAEVAEALNRFEAALEEVAGLADALSRA
ncbi:Putrescine aminotransferase [Candidatus Hydrogenisulfobacillus filiaventi]|uniref:Putrescine aminotransferase n=1 Tax=Candidatus Hydrogenisulfobacillus filiaventi TaxID=2707344 RepID=A0A6F8ZFF9_9FIRM|nr:aspartate aminotransferase family protein [Bacillota bacterium]CAB1128729.1 Putrescine aminotransferase [Candidatus Hydrogenisulfobacillus filiaventi]